MSLSLFGENAPAEWMQELITIMENQADLDAIFMVIIFFPFLFMFVLYVRCDKNLFYAMFIKPNQTVQPVGRLLTNPNRG